jgi:rhodanese-related sulfurtransferase
MLPLEAHSLVGSVCFLDVRERDEYEAGHLEGSVHIPIGEISARWRELAPDDVVVVVCQVGQRSGLVTEFLRTEGLAAHNLEGGLEGWLRAGLPLTSGVRPARVVDGYARDLSGRRISSPDPPP